MASSSSKGAKFLASDSEFEEISDGEAMKASELSSVAQQAQAQGEKNASTTLTSPRRASKAPQSISSSSPKSVAPQSYSGRDALGAYLVDPSSFPPSLVISHTDATVTLRDAFPKATVHVLLLPRSQSKTLLHPFEAFSDVGFLEQVRVDAAAVKKVAAKELKRRLGGVGGMEQDWWWEKEIRVGVHAGPSMNHLHVHIVSRDCYSERVRKRVHYNSFNTAFFVPLDEFPLAQGDPRWKSPERARLLKKDYSCWRCGAGFGNSFVRLKSHIEEEFFAWKKELLAGPGDGAVAPV